LCGAVTFEGIGDSQGAYCCHCGDCARWNGGPAMAVDFSGGFTFDGPLRWYASSDEAERGSCATCGSALFWRTRDGSMMTAAVGAFDEPAMFKRLTRHIYIDRKPTYYDFADDAPRLTEAQVKGQQQHD
jgi:hypothetical protein